MKPKPDAITSKRLFVEEAMHQCANDPTPGALLHARTGGR